MSHRHPSEEEEKQGQEGSGSNRSVVASGDDDLPSPKRSLSASEAIAAANERGYVKKRPPARQRPAIRLTRYFVREWMDRVHDRGLNKEIRILDSVRETTNYIQDTFLRPAAGKSYTEEEVEALFDQFFPAVLLGTARIKPRQTAWRCFTGWWGRESTPPTISETDDAVRRYMEQRRSSGDGTFAAPDG